MGRFFDRRRRGGNGQRGDLAGPWRGEALGWLAFLLSLPGILDSTMKHIDQRVRHALGKHMQVLHGQVGMIELTRLEFGKNHTSNHFFKTVFRGGVDGTRGRFYGIDEHQDRGFFGLGFHSRVAKMVFGKGGFGVLLQVFVPEILDELGAMMGVDEFDDGFGDTTFAKDFGAEHDMGHDGVGGYLGRQVIMG